MEKLLAKIAAYKTEINETIVSNREQLESFRIKFLGSKGLVKTIMAEMKEVAAEKKKAEETARIEREKKIAEAKAQEQLEQEERTREAFARLSQPAAPETNGASSENGDNGSSSKKDDSDEDGEI